MQYTSETRSVVRKTDGQTIQEIHLRQYTDGNDTTRYFYARREDDKAREWVRGKNRNNGDWLVTNGEGVATMPVSTYLPWFRSSANEMRLLSAPDLLVHPILSIEVDRFDHPFFRSSIVQESSDA